MLRPRFELVERKIFELYARWPFTKAHDARPSSSVLIQHSPELRRKEREQRTLATANQHFQSRGSVAEGHRSYGFCAMSHRRRMFERRERPETWVTFRTGHMGNTFRLLRAGGVDAVESEFGDGRAPSLCGPPGGWRGHDGRLPRFRHIAQDRLQIFDRYKEHGLAALSDR